MKKLFFILTMFLFLFSACAVLTPLQRGNLIAVHHLIEAGKFEEAKEVVEQMIVEDKTVNWSKTWYARGLLCQTAYQEGVRKNDKKLQELYPNQLSVAFASYERARILDRRRKMDRQLAPRYVQLSNELKKVGERHYAAERFNDALRSFEQALRINQSPVLTAEMDFDLIYNTALAAVGAQEQDKAIRHLNTLNEKKYSANVPHLLFSIYAERGDTLKAEQVLSEAITRYKENEDLVLVLVDHYYQHNELPKAIELLEKMLNQAPQKGVYHYTLGLVYQKQSQYQKAIEAYQKAAELQPDDVMTLINLATCYYNIGVEVEERSQLIRDNRRVTEEKARAQAAFANATSWLNKAYAQNPENQQVKLKLYQLYRALGHGDKARILQRQLAL